MPGLYKKHTTTQLVMPEMRLEPQNVCLTDRRLNQLSQRDSLFSRSFLTVSINSSSAVRLVDLWRFVPREIR